MSSFTPTANQRALIELKHGCHLVQAPPGTGKTQVLTQRIVSLLGDDRAATFRILALTFTTKAAENVWRRVKDSVGDAARVRACTFHSFCLGALQHYGHFVGFAADTTIYESERDTLDVLARALDEEGLRVPDRKGIRDLLERIGVAKRALKEPEAITGDHRFAVVYAAYNRVLRRFHGCDFDDLLWLTWRLLAESPKVARHYRRLFRYIMIDEAQDTSRAQYELLRAICGDEHREVMLVADSDQFIFRFAGASARWLDAFVRDFDAQRHDLTENFRCAKAVIEAANRLVSNEAKSRLRKLMVPAKPAPGRVFAQSFANEPAEARAVVSWERELLASGIPKNALYATEVAEIAPEDICVLCRNRYSLDAIMKGFKRAGVDALLRAGRQLVETPEAQLFIQGLKVIQNPADQVTRESILATWADDLLDSRVDHLEIEEFLSRLGQASPGAQPVVAELLRAGSEPDLGALVRAVASVLEEMGAAARDDGEDDRAETLAADAKTLRARWREYAGHTRPGTRSVGALLGDMALGGKSVIEGPGVRVLTIHVAKGLEFKAVALAGMNEGTLPDYRNTSRKADLSDERRVAYVGVTRASRVLLLTRPRVRVMPWGDNKTQQESRFIGEMGLTMERR